jgi:hypothetical protein
MDIRKFAAAASFATGAALALAPFASADPGAGAAAATDPVTSLFSGEAASLNSQFELDAALVGDSGDITKATAANPFDLITSTDISTVQGSGTTPFDYLIYGVDPAKAGLAGDPGSYNIFNGAEAKFIDAYNETLYGLANNNAVDPNASDFIGSASSIANAAGMDNATDAAQYYFNFGLGDLEGYLGIFPTAAPGAAAAATDPVTSLFSGEAASLNSQFELDAALVGDSGDITKATAANPFDLITPTDISTVQGSGTTPFDYLIYGVNPSEAGLAGDPGSYNIFNGAEAKLIDAFNETVYGLANSNAVDPNAADFIGSASSIAEAAGMANATDAAEYYFNFALGDLEGFLGIFPSAATDVASSLF